MPNSELPVSADAERERIAHQPVGDRIEHRRADHGGDQQAPVERALDLVGRRPHRERPDDRGEDRDTAEDQRVERDLASEVGGEGEHSEQHHRDGRHGVGLEEVSRHAGAVADVVADVVGDHGGVARVVLGDTGLDLADEVGADVGRLGEDAAAESGEDRDQRATEAEADERVDGLLVGVVGRDQDPEVAGNAEQRQADNQESGDRAALEGDVERGRHTAASCLGNAGVGADREVHADEPGRTRERATDDEADPGRDVLEDRDEDRKRNRDDADDQVLTVEVGLSAFLNRVRDLLHPIVAGRASQQSLRDERAVEHCGCGAHKCDHDAVVGQEVGQGGSSVRGLISEKRPGTIPSRERGYCSDPVGIKTRQRSRSLRARCP